MLSAIHSRCEALLGAYRFKGVTPEFLPGLSEQELERRTPWFPAPLPPELKALYSWHNGHSTDTWRTEHVFEFRGVPFIGVEDARSEYESMMETWGPESTIENSHVDLATCFPFAAANGAWLVLPCGRHDFDAQLEFPVVSVNDGCVYFHSVLSMLDTCAAWVLSPEWRSIGAHLPEREEMAIWQHYNPGVFKHVI